MPIFTRTQSRGARQSRRVVYLPIRTLVTRSAIFAAAFLCASQMHAQTRSSVSDSIRAAAFDRLDRTSQKLLWTMSCAQSSGRARAMGLFGPPDSVGRTGQCFRRDGQTFGVFFNPDSTFTKARQLRVLGFATRTRYLGPVDTTAILAEARAEIDAERKGSPSFEREKRPFAPISMRSDGDTIEVWLVPAGVLMGRTPSAIGGERGFIYSPDGRTLAREVNAFDRYRSIAIPDSGQVAILSREEDLPLMSELIVTNVLHDQGREVQVVTKTYASQLVGRDSNAAWLQLPRR
jgi:hypothetical protein